MVLPHKVNMVVELGVGLVLELVSVEVEEMVDPWRKLFLESLERITPSTLRFLRHPSFVTVR